MCLLCASLYKLIIFFKDRDTFLLLAAVVQHIGEFLWHERLLDICWLSDWAYKDMLTHFGVKYLKRCFDKNLEAQSHLMKTISHLGQIS